MCVTYVVMYVMYVMYVMCVMYVYMLCMLRMLCVLCTYVLVSLCMYVMRWIKVFAHSMEHCYNFMKENPIGLISKRKVFILTVPDIFLFKNIFTSCSGRAKILLLSKTANAFENIKKFPYN